MKRRKQAASTSNKKGEANWPLLFRLKQLRISGSSFLIDVFLGQARKLFVSGLFFIEGFLK